MSHSHLTKLLPAETKLVLEEWNAPLNDLMRVTFMHLLIKEVLKIETVIQQLNPREKVQHYRYVVRGKNFLTYQPDDIETVYLSPFQKSASIRILLQQLVRMSFQNAKRRNFIQIVRMGVRIRDCFSANFIMQIFGWFSITEHGKKILTEINAEIDLLKKELPKMIGEDKAKATAVLHAIGGNILLLNIDFSLIYQIDPEIFAELNKRPTDGTGDSSGGCGGCSYWNSGCSGCIGGGGGCSGGDSGCSGGGCSGCGGCGGCGG